MFGLGRLGRILVIAVLVLLATSLYFLYPHHDPAQSPYDRPMHYEAGGIDSEHYRKPVVPVFEEEEPRDASWGAQRQSAEPVVGESLVSDIDQDILGGGVIMPKLGNATAKLVLRSAARVLG